MESGPIRRYVSRLRDVLHDLVVAKELWIALPTALVFMTVVLAAVRHWFEAQLLVGQFTFAVGVFLFMALGITGVARTVWRAWRTLNVLVSVGIVEVHAYGGSEYHSGFVGLRDIAITTREHRGLSVELLAQWRFEDGRERRTDSRVGRKHWLLNSQEPTITEADVRFFLGYSEAAYNNPSLKAAELAEAAKAKVYLVIRDRISGKERELPLLNGRAITEG